MGQCASALGHAAVAVEGGAEGDGLAGQRRS